MSYQGDDVPTLPWSRYGALLHRASHSDPEEKTVVTEVPWFLEQELAALDPERKPSRLTPYAALPTSPEQPEPQLQPVPEPKPVPKHELLLTFDVGDDPAAPDNNSAALVPLRSGPFRAPEAFISKRPSLWARARARLLGLACLVWGVVTRTPVLNRA